MSAQDDLLADSVERALAALETPSGQRRVRESLRALSATDPRFDVDSLAEAFKELRRRSMP